MKPTIDFLGGLLLALVTAPICLVVAIIVYNDLGNPIILRQRRVGRGGRVFKRLQVPLNASGPEGTAPDFVGADRRITHKDENDPRLTNFGRFMRKWSLDELPQLWNVVLGDMSWWAPARNGADRRAVRALAAPTPRRQARSHGPLADLGTGRHPNARSHHIDVDYVDSIALSTDLKILLKTLPAAMGDSKGH